MGDPTKQECNLNEVGEITRNFIQAEMAHQDSLLQSYRSFIFAYHAILLAFASFLLLAVKRLALTGGWYMLPVFPCLIALCATLGFHAIARHRAECVDWWQAALIWAEAGLQRRPFYKRFKKSGKTRPKNFDKTWKIEKLSLEQALLIVEKKPEGFTSRNLFNLSVYGGFTILWIIILCISLSLWCHSAK